MFCLIFSLSNQPLWSLVKPINEPVRKEHFISIQADREHIKGPRLNSKQAKDLNNRLYLYVRNSLKGAPKKSALKLTNTLIEESERHNFDPVFFAAVIMTESGFRANAKGSHGEIGLMQLKPQTGAWIAAILGSPWHGEKTLRDPVENVKLGIAYFAYLSEKFDKNPTGYVNAYNLGPLKVQRLFTGRKRPGIYSKKVLGHYDNIYASLLKRKRNGIALNKSFRSTAQKL